MGRFLVVGDDLVANLRDVCGKIDSVPHNFALGRDTVGFLAEIGGTTKKMWAWLDMIAEAQPDVIFLQLGSNDLYTSSPPDVAEAIMAFAEALLYATPAKYIFIGMLLNQFSGTPPLKTEQDATEYCDKVTAVNSRLKEQAEKYSNIIYRICNGIFHPKDPIMLKDGKTLNQFGQTKFYRTIRGAFLITNRLFEKRAERIKKGELTVTEPYRHMNIRTHEHQQTTSPTGKRLKTALM